MAAARRSRRVPRSFAGGRVLVTGAGAGIGRAIALAFAGEGAAVIATDIDATAVEATRALCAEQGAATAEAHRLDVTDPGAVSSFAQRVGDEGPLDVLVNNAGVGMSARLLDMTAEDWDWIRSVNLDAVIACARAFVPAMLARGSGHVVNVASALAFISRATEPAYVTTKAAVLALSRCQRADWRPAGVGVSAVCPGVIDTGILDAARFRGDAADDERIARTRRAFGRGHPPEAVGAAVLDGIRRDRAVVPVGPEARVGRWVHGLMPDRVERFVATRGL